MDDNQKFIDAEYCIDRYFDLHLASRLDSYIGARNSSVLSEQSRGFGVRNALMPGEDYAAAVRLDCPANDIVRVTEDLVRDKHLHNDLQVLQVAWRKAVLERLGEARYDDLCRQLGRDLAEAYVEHRLTMRMVDYEVERNAYRGSVDYILDESRRSSLLMSLGPQTTALQQYIDKKIVERYAPSALEYGAGKVLGSLADTVVTAPVFGVCSWGSLATAVGIDVALNLKLDTDGDKSFHQFEHDNDVSRIVSKAVFGSERDVYSGFRHHSSSVNPYSSETVKWANELFSRKIAYRSSGNAIRFNEEMKDSIGVNMSSLDDFSLSSMETRMNHLHQMTDLHFAMREQYAGQEHAAAPSAERVSDDPSASPGSTKAVGGWGGLLDTLGLGGFGTVGKNLGYVLAMLPDMLIGMFTGKTRNLRLDDNLFPIGAIIAGMFVKNPLLKMLLIGLGGANLLNKAGHELLDNRDRRSLPLRQYRYYQDEPLDHRVTQPVMKGGTLVANVDNIPMVIAISNDAVDAYEKGVLPLNTLVNAVLRKYDEQRGAVQERFERQATDDENVERMRGLK